MPLDSRGARGTAVALAHTPQSFLCRYGHYRIRQEVAYLVAVSPTAAYMQRTYWWWRYTFPEFVLPSHLPDAPEAPGPCARDAPGYVVAERVRRKIGLWEKKLDNLLLFGHTLPTTPEVAYRQSYLAWCAATQHHSLRALAACAVVAKLSERRKISTAGNV